MGAIEVYSFAITSAPGSTAAAPQVDNLTMPARIVEAIRVRIPPGPRGQVGWALGASGQPVIPWGSQQWVVADDEVIEYTLERLIESGAWQLFSYNTGSYPHTLYVTFTVDDVQDLATAVPAAGVPGSQTVLVGEPTGPSPLPYDPALYVPPVAPQAMLDTSAGGGFLAPPIPAPVPADTGPSLADLLATASAGTTPFGLAAGPPPPAPAAAPGPTADDGSLTAGLITPVEAPIVAPVDAGPPPIDWSTVVWFTAKPGAKAPKPAQAGDITCGSLLISSNVPGYYAIVDKNVPLEAAQGILPGGRSGTVACYVPGVVLESLPGGDDEGPYAVSIVGYQYMVDRRQFGDYIGLRRIPLNTKPLHTKSGG